MMARANASVRRRRGALLIDVVMAAGMLAVALAVAVQMIGRLTAVRRALDRRQFAAAAAENTLERLAARRYDELTEESSGPETLDPGVARVLRDARLSVTVERESQAGGLAGKWIKVELRWPGAGGVDERPVVLTTWRARVEGHER
jgi:hypothetical protein